MPSPIPDPRSRRSQSRRPGAGFEVLPSEPRRGPIPDLPADLLQYDEVRAAWLSWWRSPMAHRWTASDVPGLVLLARSLQRALTGNVSAATEYRLMSSQFGLSPLGRLKLRWLVEGEDAPSGVLADVVSLHVVDDG